MSPEAGTPRRGWQPWYTVVVLGFAGWVFMYADRTVLSPVLPLVGDEFTLSQSQLGLIASLFFLAYTLLQVPAGVLADRLGKRLVLVPGLLLLAVATLFSGLAPSYYLLLGASVLAGIGQSTYYPALFALSTATVPLKHRSMAAAVINSGQSIGISLGLLVSSYVALDLALGWRLPFVALAFPTALVAIAFLIFIREPKTPGGAAEQTERAPAPRARSPFSRDYLLLYVVNFSSLYGFFVIITWLPYYLQTARAMDGMAVGWVSSLVPWMAVPGALAVSWLSDRLGNRRGVGLWMLPVAALSLAAIPLVGSYGGLLTALIVYGLVGKLALDPILIALVGDITDPSAYGTVFGVFNFAGMSASVAAPYITGLLSDMTGSLDSGFYLAAGLLLVGIWALTLAGRPHKVRAR